MLWGRFVVFSVGNALTSQKSLSGPSGPKCPRECLTGCPRKWGCPKEYPTGCLREPFGPWARRRNRRRINQRKRGRRQEEDKKNTRRRQEEDKKEEEEEEGKKRKGLAQKNSGRNWGTFFKKKTSRHFGNFEAKGGQFHEGVAKMFMGYDNGAKGKIWYMSVGHENGREACRLSKTNLPHSCLHICPSKTLLKAEKSGPTN